MTEITDLDNAETGDFIVLKNKVINFISDYDIICHYADEMCEIISTRYSLIMQAKVNTFFSAEKYDEGINQIISNDIYLKESEEQELINIIVMI